MISGVGEGEGGGEKGEGREGKFEEGNVFVTPVVTILFSLSLVVSL